MRTRSTLRTAGRIAGATIALAGVLCLTAERGVGQPCPGDCNGDFQVTLPCGGDCSGDRTVDIAELITGVGIALGNQLVTACPAFDADGNGSVVIGELITAVNNALRGVPAGGVKAARLPSRRYS